MKILAELLERWRNLDGRTRLWSGYGLVVLLVIALLWSALDGRTAVLERKRLAREAVLKELMPLKVTYLAAKVSSDMLMGRLSSVRPDETPAKVIDEIGIKGKGLKITQVKGEERPGFIEDAADVRIEGLTLNEAVNLVYKLENGSRPIVVKKGNIRMRFDDPSRCDLAMVVALLKPAPGVPK
jgi:general secretion pathway protein M